MVDRCKMKAVWIPESLLEESCPPALKISNQILLLDFDMKEK